MLKLTMITAALALSFPALAGQSCYQMGNQYHCNGTGEDLGESSTSYQMGNQIHIHENNLNTGKMGDTTCYMMGNQMHCN